MTGEGWRLAREAKQMTLRALAAAAGISAPFQSDVEHGRRHYSLEVEKRVRDVLGLDPAPEPPKHLCVICETPLMDETTKVYRGDPMHAIIGPGYANQLSSERNIWCPKCGVSYHHLPKDRYGREEVSK
jgi:transcriptional regulator with XRE-family HTH domain